MLTKYKNSEKKMFFNILLLLACNTDSFISKDTVKFKKT